MPVARRKRERIQQIANWLSHKYPTRRPVYLAWSEEASDDIMVASKHRRSWTLRACARYPLYVLEEALLHEWAHIRRWSDLLEHPDAWGGEYAMLYRDWYDGLGKYESADYPW